MKLWIDDVRPAPESFIPCWEWVDTVNKAKNCIIKECAYFEDCETKEDREGCYHGILKDGGIMSLVEPSTEKGGEG